MSNLSQAIAQLTESVNQLMNEVISQKDRFMVKAGEVADHVSTALGYSNQAKEAAKTASGHKDSASASSNLAAVAVEDARAQASAARSHANTAGGHASSANTAKSQSQAFANESASSASQSDAYSNQSAAHTRDAKEQVQLCSNQADRAHDAVAGLAADIVELKALIVKSNPMA